MRTIIFIVFALAFASCNGGSRQSSSNQEKNPLNATPPAFEFVEEIHSFGELQSGEKVIYSFVFTNSGGSDIKIEKAEAECVCLEISYENAVIKAGEKGKLRVVYDTSGQFGPQFQMFRLTANNGTLIKDLAVTAEVKNEDIIYK